MSSMSDEASFTIKGLNTRARIVECALTIFAVEGDGGLTIRKVASAVGLSPSNVQHYFPSREDLFTAIIRQTVADYRRRYEQIVNARGLTSGEKLAKVARLLIDDDKDLRVQALFVNIWALAQKYQFAADMMDEMYRTQRSMLEVFVKDVNPMLSAGDVSRRAALITAQIEGLLVLLPKRTRFPAELKGLEEDAVRAIVALAEHRS
ncbi:TetR/AcrR family transcriptional regulator [Burkholderia multivorans]|uniref:TetR/AcrR family transcriptional regulator n=1 Tax=Burkholderia multivorans TaxID=87883 RepID=UPI001C230499|nr:TetR/AcrR family transcriptional regulator [Burkholderia multivorans]MBU9224627.1 TetR/AcrR family transcriptional regulator [Burkholderia multivorans]MBU9418098.1 TetR/AcrR family transcriptional regulator [Burkholderia multivorans]MBU9479604.1 TetR/AcrR family transcriptional regulator [Burkholderia multivorans]